MNQYQDRLLREFAAALIGSRMKPSEVIDLIELLEVDSSFRRRLSKSIVTFIGSLNSKFDHFGEEMIVQDNLDFGSSGLVDFVYDIVQKRKINRKKLISLFKKSAPGIKWQNSSGDWPVRQLIDRFLSSATTKESHDLLSALGILIDEDPYLAGVSGRRI